MSGIPPPTRRRTKTGGLSDFFGSGSSRQTPKHPQAPSEAPSVPPPMPHIPPMPLNSQPESSSSSLKGKKSSIPFWKKKDAPQSSIPSPASILKRKSTTRLPTSPPLIPPPLPPRSSATYVNASGPSSLNSSAGRTSTQTQASPREAAFPHIPAVPRLSSASATTSPTSRQSPFAPSTATSTLSSKFAAHFAPSKAHKNTNAHGTNSPNINAHIANSNIGNANIAIATKRERDRDRRLSTSVHAPSSNSASEVSPPHSPKTAQGQGQSPRTSQSPRASSIPTSASGMSSIPSPTGSAFKFPRSKPTGVGPPPGLGAGPGHAQAHTSPTPPPSASIPALPPAAPTPVSASTAPAPPPPIAPRLAIPPHARPPSPARSSTSTTRPTFTAPNAPHNHSPTSPTALYSDSPASSTSHLTSSPTPILSISPPEELFKDEEDDFEFCTPRTAPTPPGTSPTLAAVPTPKELRQRRGMGTGVTTPGSMKEREVKEVAGKDAVAVAGYFDIPPAPAQMLGFATPSPPPSPRVQFSHPPGLSGYSQQQQSAKGKGKAKVDEFGALVTPSTQTTTKKSARKHSISVVRELEHALGTSLAVDFESSDDDSEGGGDGSDSDNTIPSHDVPPSSSTSTSVGSLGVEALKAPSRRSSLVMLEQYQLQQQQQQAGSSTLSVSRTPSSSSARMSLAKAKASASSLRSQAGPPPTTPLPSTPGASTPPTKDFPPSPASHQMAMGMGSLAMNPSAVGSRRQSALSPVHRDTATPRPRAQTIAVSSTPDAKAPSAMSTASRSLNSSNDASRRHSRGHTEDLMTAVQQNAPPPKEKRKMTYEEMEVVLADYQDRYKTLTAYLETVTDKLEREKALQADEIEGLRATAEGLQRETDKWKHEAKMRSKEAKKRELEIGGLKWLIMHPIPPSSREEKASEVVYDDDASTDAGTGSAAPSFVFSNDSGVISQSRAAQALRKRSTTISDFRPSPPPMRKPKSSSLLSSYSNRSSVTGFGLGIDYTIPDVPYTKYLPDPSLSTSSSASSSTTSLVTPSLTGSNTAPSGLSVIPESPPSSSDGHSDLSAQTHVDHGKDEKRSSRVARRISGSSLASSSASTAASASVAYASNLKVGRGPSIEQVLDAAPPTMEEVMEKLRPFGNS